MKQSISNVFTYDAELIESSLQRWGRNRALTNLMVSNIINLNRHSHAALIPKDRRQSGLLLCAAKIEKLGVEARSSSHLLGRGRLPPWRPWHCCNLPRVPTQYWKNRYINAYLLNFEL